MYYHYNHYFIILLYIHITILRTTVAQKTVQMFACFGKIELVQDTDIIQGPEFFYHKKYNIVASQNILDHVI